jgi:hypothetical protein
MKPCKNRRHNCIEAAQKMPFGHAVFETEFIEQRALIRRLPSRHRRLGALLHKPQHDTQLSQNGCCHRPGYHALDACDGRLDGEAEFEQERGGFHAPVFIASAEALVLSSSAMIRFL